MKHLKTYIQFLKESIDIEDINDYEDYKNLYIKEFDNVIKYAKNLIDEYDLEFDGSIEDDDLIEYYLYKSGEPDIEEPTIGEYNLSYELGFTLKNANDEDDELFSRYLENFHNRIKKMFKASDILYYKRHSSRSMKLEDLKKLDDKTLYLKMFIISEESFEISTKECLDRNQCKYSGTDEKGVFEIVSKEDLIDMTTKSPLTEKLTGDDMDSDYYNYDADILGSLLQYHFDKENILLLIDKIINIIGEEDFLDTYHANSRYFDISLDDLKEKILRDGSILEEVIEEYEDDLDEIIDGIKQIGNDMQNQADEEEYYKELDSEWFKHLDNDLHLNYHLLEDGNIKIYFDHKFIEDRDNEYIQNFNLDGLIREWIVNEWGYLSELHVRDYYGSINDEYFNKEIKAHLQ